MSRSYKHDRIDNEGREVPDPTPLAPPVGYKRSPSIAEQIRSMVRSEALAAAARDAGMETFEEADDFDVSDDVPDPSTPFEHNFDQPSVRELREREAKAKREADELERAERDRHVVGDEPQGERQVDDRSTGSSGAAAGDKPAGEAAKPRKRRDIDD